MATSLSNPNYTNKLSDRTSSFEEFAPNRERSTRAASFAIPSNASIIEFIKRTAEPITNKFMLAPPSASTINIRRHSLQQCQAGTGTESSNPNNGNNSSSSVPAPPLNPAPPPIPKRTFLGKIIAPRSSSDSSPTSSIKTTINNMCRQTLDEVKRRNASNKPAQGVYHSRRVENHYPIDQYSDDDRLSIESSVFEEPKSSDPIIFANSSNRSSSDSNKSHITNDTGYMSASNDTDRIFFGASEDFRSRFSSVDTQSSLDSCTSSDIQSQQQQQQQQQQSFSTQNQTRCTMSPLALKRDDSDEKSKNQPKNFNRMNSSNSMLFNNFKCNPNNICSTLHETPNRLPPVPLRKQTSIPKIIPTNYSNSNKYNVNNRGPPPPPTRSLDSGRILYNGSMLGAFQSGLAKITSAAANTSDVVMGRKSFKRNNSHKNNNTSNNNNNNISKNNNNNATYNQKQHHVKLNQRQDSNISSDSFSLTSSPGYNTKNMEAPLLQYASKINKTNCMNSAYAGRSTMRQDSSLSSDSFSQTSSPGYNIKLLEQPVLPHMSKLHALKQHLKYSEEIMKDTGPTSPITKSASTPASLQTIVRFQNGSNMSLQHKVINRRKSSNPYITRGRFRFRLLQILLNALALLIIAGGLAAYFKANPAVKFINKTIIAPQRIIPVVDKNPALGLCLPIIVKFCQNQVPYNYTTYPNYIGHFSQLEAEEDLEAYDALVDVKCYELTSLFLCSLFVPKCGSSGIIPPCKSLCMETMRRCGFFFGVFSLELPDYLKCSQLVDSSNPDLCVGQKQIKEAYNRALKPVCSGFLCDKNRCIPNDWRCDGHVDCFDQSDESKCDICGPDSIYCGDNKCMSSKHVCDGEINCPYGQDERNCIRLSEQNGDLGKGFLEVYRVKLKKWVPACVANWDPQTSPASVCSLLGYTSVNSSRLAMRDSNLTLLPSSRDSTALWHMYQQKRSNIIKEFSNCPAHNYPVVDLTCSNYECGKIRNRRYRVRTRIVGGSEALPGDWPFLAAILGGPEEIFYCAGVLIADQWILTASHCIGNRSLHHISSWTIQLGITRRHSHTYYGQKVKVQRVIPHPHYNLEVIHDNDIALFQLATRVAFHEHLLPVCLPPPTLSDLKPGTMCTVIGWGKKEDKKPSASYEPTVNEVQVPILHRDLCNEWLVQLNVTDGMICAGYSEGGKDACQGDSGGPLLCRDPNDRERYFVAGIVSWGVKCANPKLPGVYANVPKYIPWILQNMQNYSNLPVEKFNDNNQYIYNY